MPTQLDFDVLIEASTGNTDVIKIFANTELFIGAPRDKFHVR